MNLDQRLLEVLEVMYEVRSVSRTSDVLDVGQPAVSVALGRLREHFNDPLFIRVKNTMEPTAAMHALYPHVRTALAGLRSVLEFNQGFDPVVSDHCFAISMTDITHIVLLPKLWMHLRASAPNIQVKAHLIRRDTPEKLKSGDIDLVIGSVPHMEAGFYQQTLFTQNFVCLASASHPRIRQRLALEDYEAEGHVSVAASNTGHTLLDAVLKKSHIKRRVELELPTFLGLGHLIEQTELIASVPEMLGQILSKSNQVKMFPLPFGIQSYNVNQYWHERFHNDRRHQWLRQAIATLLGRPGQLA